MKVLILEDCRCSGEHRKGDVREVEYREGAALIREGAAVFVSPSDKAPSVPEPKTETSSV